MESWAHGQSCRVVLIVAPDTKRSSRTPTAEAAAMDKAAENALSCLTDEDVEQFAALNEKISLALHEQGISAKKKGHLVKRHKKHGCKNQAHAGMGHGKKHNCKCKKH